jgi:hypothetical protein
MTYYEWHIHIPYYVLYIQRVGVEGFIVTEVKGARHRIVLV